MSSKPEYVPLEQARAKLGKLADEAHNDGKISYLTRHGKAIAAVVPVGSRASALPASIIDAAYDAAFPGLPKDMTEGEAKRRLTAALNATHGHLADILDRAFQEGADRAMSEAWRRFELNEEEPDNPSADALARHIADHPVSTIQAAMRILGWQVSFKLVMPENEEEA
jgi:antitoxin (DNA-binding transcriptional repressor) of toxin-antitoxin stability system